MEEKNKKRIIALLLLVSCIVSALLLAFTTASSQRGLRTFAEADSVLEEQFNTFGIAGSQVEREIIAVDSLLDRVNYRVALPPGFSKTQLHAEIHRAFRPYRVDTPAETVFPEEELNIHLLYRETVIRSIRLYTDPELQMQRNFASILVVLEETPTASLLELIRSFGEPLVLVLKTDDPETALEMKAKIRERYPHWVFWLQDEDGDGLLKTTAAAAMPKLQHLQRAEPDAGVVTFRNLEAAGSDKLREQLSRTSLRFIDLSEAVQLDPVVGETAFKQELNKFRQLSQRKLKPIAVVEGTLQSLRWLQEELAEFKKSGMQIILPDTRSF